MEPNCVVNSIKKPTHELLRTRSLWIPILAYVHSRSCSHPQIHKHYVAGFLHLFLMGVRMSFDRWVVSMHRKPARI